MVRRSSHQQMLGVGICGGRDIAIHRHASNCLRKRLRPCVSRCRRITRYSIWRITLHGRASDAALDGGEDLHVLQLSSIALDDCTRARPLPVWKQCNARARARDNSVGPLQSRFPVHVIGAMLESWRNPLIVDKSHTFFLSSSAARLPASCLNH